MGKGHGRANPSQQEKRRPSLGFLLTSPAEDKVPIIQEIIDFPTRQFVDDGWIEPGSSDSQRAAEEIIPETEDKAIREAL